MTDNEELDMSLPGYIGKHLVRPGQDPRHLIEHILTRLWSMPGCWHSFELLWSIDSAQFVAGWVVAPESYWRGFLENAFGAEAENVEEMIAGLEEMLAAQPDKDDDRG